jgi:hypothetical protein
VHYTQLHDRLRPDGADGVRQPGQCSPAQQTMHTSATPRDFSSDSTVSQILLDSPAAGPRPQPEDLRGAVTVDADGQVDRAGW